MNFPTIDQSDAFGQYINAEIASQITDTGDLIDAVLMLQPKEAQESSGASLEDIVTNIANDLLEELPQTFDIRSIIKKWINDSSALKVFMVQECQR